MPACKQNQLMGLIQAFGAFQGRSLRMLDAAENISAEEFAACYNVLDKLYNALETTQFNDDEFNAEAVKIMERICKVTSNPMYRDQED